MTDEEIKYIIDTIKEADTPPRFSAPMLNKIDNDEIDVSIEDIQEDIAEISPESIVEYSFKSFPRPSRRVLIRSKEITPLGDSYDDEIDCNLCFSLSLDNNCVVTAYYNSVEDDHSNLNMNQYDENFRIIPS